MDLEEEAWDESIMGPKEGDLGGVLKSGDTSSHPNPKLLRKQSSGAAAPPTSMFMTAVQGEPASTTATTTTTRSSSLVSASSASERSSARMKAASKFLQEEDNDPPTSSAAGGGPSSPDSRRIRQEALRMLEVADDQLADSNYSVYRTSTGGFSASPRQAADPPPSTSFTAERRKPAALSGVSFATSRKNVAKPFRDDPYADTEAPAPASQADYEYGEENAVVDVKRMENRSAASREADSSKSNWSSRYSIDHTLLALSGGSVSSSKLLDKMDKEHSDSRRSARNMFGSSPSETKSPQVFGSGFSFRQKNVFGQQGATVPKKETNLKTVWVDSSPEEAVSPARSWQEQFEQQRRKRRRVMIAAAVLALLLFLLLITRGARKRDNDSAKPIIHDTPQPDANSVTFYVTSDVPLTPGRDNGFNNDMQSMSHVADFMVHLGDIQIASETQCQPGRYAEVADVLKRSPKPVFVVPGEEDWANCPSQEDGWDNWVDNFWEFEQNWNLPFNVMRFEELQENFAFFDKGVLFVGVHETNGRIEDYDELNERNNKNVDWVTASYENYKDSTRAMVILANGRPAIRENDNFYLGVGDFLFRNKVPTAYIHANHENGEELTYKPFSYEGMEHVIAVQTAIGNEHAPLRINVGFDPVNPFIVG